LGANQVYRSNASSYLLHCLEFYIDVTLSLSAAAAVCVWCAFKVKSKDGDNGWMPIKDAAGWIAETLLYRFLFPKNNFFFSFPFFSFVVRSKHCKRYKTFISLCVCHSVWVVCVCIRWLPIVPLNAIPQSTLTVYRSVDSAHTHTHTHTLFSLVQFHESGEGKKKRWRGRDRERKRILVTIKSSPICI
jgi:hypothetical protein